MKIHRLLVDQVVQTLTEIFSGRVYADKAVERVLKNQRRWGARDRRFFAESVYECVRWKRRLAFLAGVSESDSSQDDCFRMWTTFAFEQGWLENPEEWGVRPAILEQKISDLENRAPLAVRESIPDWMDQLGRAETGDRWPAIVSSLNDKATVDLRVNTLKGNRRELQDRLRSQDGFETEAIKDVPTALALKERRNVFTTESFKLGLFEVQDRASQMVAPLLDPQPGDRVVDACAGAGGKSLHIAALMQNKGRLLSMDIHEWKLKELRTRASRDGVDIIETRVIESTKTIKRLADQMDRVLLDVPCSGIGVLRRNPDSKWKLGLAELERLRALQFEILSSYSRMVKPGGILVYATCSFLPSENDQQVRKFLAGGGWELLGEVKVFPDEGRGDGFYAAKIRRNL